MSEYAVLLGGGHEILQSTEGYAFTQDSVLLANLTKAGAKDRVLDLGCGGGVVGILLLLKKNVREVVGIDVDAAAVDLARRNVELNSLSDRMTVKECDVRLSGSVVGAGTFDKAVCNPPYYAFDDGAGASRNSRAKREGDAVLADFVVAGARALKNGGDFVLVHKTDRLCDAVSAMRAAGLEPKRLVEVYPKPDAPAGVFVMTARKGGAVGLVVESLTVRDAQGNETDAFKELYEWQNSI